ncbi:uncharacterized protein [Dermacentor albipictus]|uniref:uncharacterized protein n=1 Tax=Dermacentor albipictus TaxID=60249 RepID=UPI0038FCF0B4
MSPISTGLQHCRFIAYPRSSLSITDAALLFSSSTGYFVLRSPRGTLNGGASGETVHFQVLDEAKPCVLFFCRLPVWIRPCISVQRGEDSTSSSLFWITIILFCGAFLFCCGIIVITIVTTGGNGDRDVVDKGPDLGSGGGGGGAGSQGPGPVGPTNPPVISSGTDTTNSGQPTSAGPPASPRSQATPTRTTTAPPASTSGGSGDSDVVDDAPDQGSGGGGGQGPGPVGPTNPPVISSGTDTTSSGQPTSAGSAASARSQATPTITTTAPPANTSAPKPEVATPMAPYSYVCTISEAWRGNTTYLPPDNACDYLFYDSLYKDNKNALIDGVHMWDAGAQQFIRLASVYKHTKLGFSFASKLRLLSRDIKDPKFFTTIDDIWRYNISHFGFLDVNRWYPTDRIVYEFLNLLKAVYLHLKPKTSPQRPSYYVLGLYLDPQIADYRAVKWMKTFFTPSMFISIAHLPYSVSYARNCRIIPVAMAEPLPVDVHWNTDGHTVNDSLDLLREVAKLGLSIPLAMSFGMRGLVYAPKFLNEAAPTIEEFQLLKPCKDFEAAKYEDPKKVCAEGGWIASSPVPGHAYNVNQRKAFTYLTELRIATLACEVKKFRINLDFALAAYDVDYDAELSCAPFGFLSLGQRFGRVIFMRKVTNFFRTNYTTRKGNIGCKLQAFPDEDVG